MLIFPPGEMKYQEKIASEMHLDDRVHIMNFLQTSKLCMKDKTIAPS